MSGKGGPDDRQVEQLIEQIRQAARFSRAKPRPAAPAAGPSTPETPGALDFHFAELARLSRPRTELPRRFQRFPFSLPPLRKAALGLYNLLTHQQRASNVAVRDALQAMQRALARNETALRETAVLTDYVRAFLIHARTSSPTGGAGPSATTDDLDAFYVALEDEFRGASELIEDRLGVYLPLLRAANVTGPVLDLGCGRGEWLELMRDADVEAIGVEHNPLLVAACRGKGLHVLEADLQSFLEQSPSQHWQLVTAFHVIEHLGWPAWYLGLRHVYRALRPGGMLILETPNPGNLFTAANRFYLDPTHRHPLPDSLLEFAARNVGFPGVQILPLHPESSADETGATLAAASALVARLTGAQDYALIARK